jgi:hypothetical protein
VWGGHPPGIFLKIEAIIDPLRAILGPKTFKYMAFLGHKYVQFKPLCNISFHFK